MPYSRCDGDLRVDAVELLRRRRSRGPGRARRAPATACGRPSRSCGSPTRRRRRRRATGRRPRPARASRSSLACWMRRSLSAGTMLSIGVPSACEERRLVAGRQEAAGEVLQAAAGHDAEAQHDEAGQVAVLAAQAVGHPRAEARPAGVVAAGVQEQHAGRVQRQVGLHRADHGQVVGARGDVREQLADRHAATGRAAGTSTGSCSHLRLPLAVGFFDSVNGLPSSSASFGLGSNESTCETPPSMKQKMTFLARGAKVRLRRATAPSARGAGIVGQQPGQGEQAEAVGRRRQHLAARAGGAGMRPGQPHASAIW